MGWKSTLGSASALAFVVTMGVAAAAPPTPASRPPAPPSDGYEAWTYVSEEYRDAAAPPLPAPAPVSGSLEAYTGWGLTTLSESQFGGSLKDRFDGWPLGGAGHLTFWLSPSASIQLDAQGEGTSYRDSGGASGHFSTHAYLIGGHLNWRDPQRGLIGVFGGAGDAGGAGIGGTGIRHGVIGAEGQWYHGPLTFYLQGGYARTVSPIDSFLDDHVSAWFFRGTGRWFLRPDLMIEGTGLYANGDLAFGGSSVGVVNNLSSRGFQSWLWQAKIEWWPRTWPLAVFAKYQGSQTHWDDMDLSGEIFTQRITDHRVLAGLHLYFGSGTLLANDRNGTTLGIIDPLATPTSPIIFAETQGLIISDMRLKRDIELVGRLDDGLGLYRYRYLWSDTVHVGVMAQEVAALYPAAVVRGADGYLRVDYRRLGLKLMTLAEWNGMTYGVR